MQEVAAVEWLEPGVLSGWRGDEMGSTDLELAKEIVKHFGWRRSSELFGTCLVIGLQRIDPATFDEQVPPERTTLWRARRDLKQFGQELRARGLGYLLDDEDELTPKLVRRAAAALR